MIGADPQQLRDLAAFMKQRADLFDSIAQDLGRRLCSVGWYGQDAEEARARWDSELRPKMRSAVQALMDARVTLERHAREQEQASDGGGGGGSSQGRQTNKSIWDLTGSKDVGPAYGKSRFLDQKRRTVAMDPETGKWSVTNTDVEDGAKNRVQESSDMAKTWKSQLAPQTKIDILSGQYAAECGKARKSVSGEYGTVYGEAKGGYVEADAHLAYGSGGIEGNAAVELGLAKVGAGAAASAFGGAFAGKATAEASVAAEAHAKVAVGKEGVKASAGAFAGAKATGELGASVAGIGGKVVGEAWAGAGAEAEGTARMEDGKLKIGASFGAGLGVGAKLGFQVTIDVKQTSKTISDGANAVSGFFTRIFK